jgi:hypothetical protein
MRTIKIVIVALISLLAWTQVLADWDARLEAEEAAKRQRAAAVERQRQAEARAAKDAAMVQAARRGLGKAADGKTDAQALALYDAKTKRDQAAAMKAMAAAPAEIDRIRTLEAGTRGQRDDLMKKNYGKSVTQLQGMSDAELDKFAREVEKKHGR